MSEPQPQPKKTPKIEILDEPFRNGTKHIRCRFNYTNQDGTNTSKELGFTLGTMPQNEQELTTQLKQLYEEHKPREKPNITTKEIDW